MCKGWRFNKFVIGILFSICVSTTSVNAVVIELALVLDGSGSISDSDFSLQTQAYNNIFSNNFYSTYLSPEDTLYVSAYQFSTNVQQEIGYTLINSDESAATFGGLFLPIQQTNGLTNTSGGVNLAVADLLNNGIGGGVDDVMLIDVSTDGLPNVGGGITSAIDAATAAAAAGVTVNAIGVGVGANGEAFLDDFSTAGEGFFLTADNFNDFEETLELKLVSEVTGVDPTNPVDPVDPTNPVDPVDPTNPVDPVDPTNPVDPVDPTNPVDPVDPTNPVDPVDPTNPVDPVDPTNPVDPVDPTNPVDPVDPTNPVDPVDPTNPVDPVDPTNPIDPVDPTNPVDPVDPTNPVDPVDPTNPVDPVDPTNPVDPVDPNIPLIPVDPIAPTNPVTPTGASVVSVPEPVSILLLSMGLLGLGIARKKII